ncbi:MAG: tripartite tricarboxylate transporter substrate binding protein, partial [Betaproteobacteria bacterium]
MIVAVHKLKCLILLLSLALAASAPAIAQESYPSRSVRLVIDTSPGGVTDLFGRLAAEALTAKLGQTVYVDNKPGASGNVAIDFLVRSVPDGYTLMIASGGGIVVKPFLERGLTFDVMNDLVPVFNFAEVAHILVVPATVPAKDVAEFVALARAQPGKLY